MSLHDKLTGDPVAKRDKWSTLSSACERALLATTLLLTTCTHAGIPQRSPPSEKTSVEPDTVVKHDTTTIRDTVRVTDTVRVDAQPNQERPAYHRPEPHPRYADDHIPILMYHKIGRPENRYTVSPSRLRQQLETLHDRGYHCVSLDDYLTADFSDVPPGKKPVVLTFDDAAPSQFQLRNGEPTEDSAVGILQDIFTTYEDFGKSGVFYVSYAGDDHDFRHAFGGGEDKKLTYLQRHGYTVGYHTPYHTDNEHAVPEDVDEQATILNALIAYNADEPSWKHYAHPFGSDPERRSTERLLREEYTSVMNAWGGLAPHPRSPAFDPHSIPRIETNAETFQSVLNREAWVKPAPTAQQRF